MSSLGGPSIVTNGLVLHLDAANKKSLQDITTNLNIYSQNYVASTYNFGGILSATTGYLAPDGSYTACLMIEDTANTIHRWYVNPPITLSSNTLYTFSIYVKSAGRTKGLWFNEWTSGRVGILYDLTLGTISTYTTSTGVLTSSTITNVGNGWYRISYTCQDSASLAGTIYDLRLVDNTGLLTYAGDGVSGVYYWGIQLEANSYPTTYLPTSGAIASRNICYDRSGNGNTGTLVNGPTYNSLKGGSISFDGNDDYINCGNTTNLQSLSQITLSVWVKFSGLDYVGNTGRLVGFISKGLTDTAPGIPNTGFWFSYENRNNANKFTYTCFGNTAGGYAGGVNNFSSKSYTFTNGIWYNITATVDSLSKGSLFINGTQLGASVTFSNLSIPNTVHNLYVGRIEYTTYNLNGNISQTFVYNRALSPTEVLQNYNATKSRFI